MKELTIQSNKKEEFITLDRKLQSFIDESNVQDGVLTIFVPHTTAAVTINENADPDVTRDIINHLGKMVPHHAGFSHSEGNSDAHIKSSLLGPSLQCLVSGGRLVFGTWQSVYFCEFDGPRSRKIFLKLVEEK